MLSRSDLDGLLRVTDRPCVSIYLPTHRSGADTRQDPIRFENLLRRAERELEDLGLRRAQIDDLLAPSRALLTERTFWQHQGDGLAVFAASNAHRAWRVPLAFDELLVVGMRFHVKPLLPLLTGDGRFHVLALSQQRTRLFEATRFTIREIDLHDIPESLLEAVGYDFEQRSLQFRSGGRRPGRARGPALFHGHGAGRDTAKEEIEKFLRLVDRGVLDLLQPPHVPLVLAAVDYLVAFYRRVSEHPDLLGEAVEGNPDGIEPADLHRKAWALVEKRFQAERTQALTRFRQLKGTRSPQAGTKLEAVVRAAWEGRVEALFLARGVQRWGRFDPAHLTIERRRRRRPGDEDLLDTAAFLAYGKGAAIYLLDEEGMPDGTPIAATYRYG